jgi:hypothetical protein
VFSPPPSPHRSGSLRDPKLHLLVYSQWHGVKHVSGAGFEKSVDATQMSERWKGQWATLPPVPLAASPATWHEGACKKKRKSLQKRSRGITPPAHTATVARDHHRRGVDGAHRKHTGTNIHTETLRESTPHAPATALTPTGAYYAARRRAGAVAYTAPRRRSSSRRGVPPGLREGPCGCRRPPSPPADRPESTTRSDASLFAGWTSSRTLP